MFSFGGEVLITEIIDAIEGKEPVHTRLFPTLLRRELRFGGCPPHGWDTGQEGAGPWAAGDALLDVFFLPHVLVALM